MMQGLSKAKMFALGALAATFILGEIGFYIFTIGAILYFLKEMAFLTLLFFSGTLKNIPLMGGFPIDFTLLTFLLFCVTFFLKMKIAPNQQKNIIVLLQVVLCIFLVVVFSLARTPAPWSYISNSGVFIVLIYLPLVTMILFLRYDELEKNIDQLHRFSLIVCYSWVGLGLHNLITGFSPPRLSEPQFTVDHISAFGEDYMVFASFLVFIIIDALIEILFKRKYLLHAGLLCIFLYALVNAPARGLFIGIFSASSLLLILWLRNITPGKLLGAGTFIAALISGGITYVTFYATEKQLYLLSRLFDFSATGSSANLRLKSVQIGFEKWLHNPLFGGGTDSVAFFNGNPGYYTHNLLLEIIFEYGLLGGIPLLLFLGATLMGWFMVLRRATKQNNLIHFWFVSVLIAFFLFGMFSGTLGNIRQLWILSALVLALGLKTANALNQSPG